MGDATRGCVSHIFELRSVTIPGATGYSGHTATDLNLIIASTRPFSSISDEPFACYIQLSGPVCLRSLCNHRYQLRRKWDKWGVCLKWSLHAIRLLWQINHQQYIRRIMHKTRVLLCFVVRGCRTIVPITMRALSNHTDIISNLSINFMNG